MKTNGHAEACWCKKCRGDVKDTTYLVSPETALKIDAKVDRLKAELDQAYGRMGEMLKHMARDMLPTISRGTVYGWFNEDGTAKRGLEDE